MAVVSVIVPVYNRKVYIRRCLDSILRQTYQDFELIVIDDGSNDGTENICDEYEGKHSKTKIIHQKNEGVSKARNAGIRNAEGQWCIFVDSDDYIPPNYLTNFIKAYEKYGEKYIFLTSYMMYTTEGIQYLQYRKDTLYSLITNNIFFDLMDQNGLFNAVNNKMYQVQLLKEYNIKFPENVDLGEDLIFNLRYCDKKGFEFVVLNKNFYCYSGYEREDSLEHRWRKDYDEIQRKLLKEKLRYIHKWEKGGKIVQENKDYKAVWYVSYICENIGYYIKNTKNGNMNILGLLKKVVEIKRSQEYRRCVQLNDKRGLYKKIAQKICVCLKE